LWEREIPFPQLKFHIKHRIICCLFNIYFYAIAIKVRVLSKAAVHVSVHPMLLAQKGALSYGYYRALIGNPMF